MSRCIIKLDFAILKSSIVSRVQRLRAEYMNILGSDSAPKYLCNAAQVDANEEMSFNSLYQSGRIYFSQAFKLDFKNRIKQRCEMIRYCL